MFVTDKSADYIMFKSLFYGIFIIAFCISCKQWSTTNQEIDRIVENKIDELSLESFPEIEPCKGTSRSCFEKQLSNILQLSLPKSISSEGNLKDTLWVSITVNNKGVLTSTFHDKTLFTDNLQQYIDSTIINISPIEPGYIQGIPVTCNFNLPLIINLKN